VKKEEIKKEIPKSELEIAKDIIMELLPLCNVTGKKSELAVKVAVEFLK